MGWLSGWSYRKAITVTEQSGNDLDYYHIRVDLDSSNFDFSKANSDGSDIRFTESDGTTLLYHWIEKWDSSNQKAILWVKTPSISANDSITVYMYYGKSDATDTSDGENTFELFDDFDGTEVDTNKWETTDYGEYEVVDSCCKLKCIFDDADCYIKSKDSFDSGCSVRCKSRATYYGNHQDWLYIDSSGYDVAVAYEKDNCGYQKNSSMGWGLLHEVTLDTEFHTFEISVLSDKVIFSHDDQDYYTETTYVPSSPVKVMFSEGEYNEYMIVDWVFVRKFVDPEPSISIGAEETQMEGAVCLSDNFQFSDGLEFSQELLGSLLDDINAFRELDVIPGWLTGWSFRRKIVITEQSGKDLYDYPIGIFLNKDNFDFFHAKEDGGDIRFTREDGRLLVSYWKEKWDYENKKAIFWVKVPFIPANGSTTIYLYYGNESATDISEDIFDFLDDFEGTSFDTNVWFTDDTYGVGNCLGCYDDEVVVSDSIATIDRTGKGGIYFGCKTFFSRPCIFEMKVRRSNDSKCNLFVEDVNMYGEGQGAYIDKLGITGGDYYCEANGYAHSFGKSISLAEWTVFTIKYGENGTVFQLDYGEKDETSSSEEACNPQDDLTFRFFIEYSKLEIDWVRVRKYAFPEPLVDIKSACGYVDEVLDHYNFIDGFYFLEVLQNEVDLSDEINFTYDLYGIIEDTNSNMTLIAPWLSWSINYEGCMGDPEDTISFSDELDYQLPYSTSYLQDTLSYSEALIPHYVLHLSLSDNLYPVLYGIDGLSVSSYTKLEDLFALLDALLYRRVSTLISEDIFSALSDNIEKLKLISSLGDLLSLEDFLNSGVVLILSSNVALTDGVFFLIPGFFTDTLSLYDTFSTLLSAKVSSYSLTLSEDIKILFSLKKESSFDLSDHLAPSLITGITFEDFLSLVDALLPLGKTDIRLFFSLISYPENLFYSFYSTSIKITGIDGILTAEDGIYIFDEERTTGDLMFRFGDMSSSRLKRIDKIFASTPLEKATIHADGSSYSYIGNKWISCGKGLKGKELKVLLENLGDIEFISFRLVELRRPK